MSNSEPEAFEVVGEAVFDAADDSLAPCDRCGKDLGYGHPEHGEEL